MHGAIFAGISQRDGPKKIVINRILFQLLAFNEKHVKHLTFGGSSVSA
jgi:hypothetical protein